MGRGFELDKNKSTLAEVGGKKEATYKTLRLCRPWRAWPEIYLS